MSEEDTDSSETADSGGPVVPPPPPPPSPREQAEAELEELKTQILLAPPKMDEIPFALVSRHDKKTVRLVANSGSKGGMRGKRIWFSYEFNELVFIEEFSVSLRNYDQYDEFDLAFVNFDGQRFEETIRPRNGLMRKTLNRIVKEVSFRPPRKTYGSGHISEVSLAGFPLSDISKIGAFAEAMEAEKTEANDELQAKHLVVLQDLTALKRLEDQRESITEQVESAKKDRAKIADEIGKLRSRRDETVARIETLKQSERESNQNIEDQKDKVAEVSKIRSNLATSIIEKKAKLQALTANINLFPSELSDFVAQGGRDVRMYAGLAFIPILVIAMMFGILVKGGVDLTTLITGREDINIVALVLSRLPFVVVAVTVITACYYLARMFILEMVRVNRQKLSLTKIGIIAKDISYSVTNELNLSEDEKYARRLTLKMDMLRDHLKEYLTNDFEPSLPKRSPFEQMRLPGINRGERNIDQLSETGGSESDDLYDVDDVSEAPVSENEYD